MLSEEIPGHSGRRNQHQFAVNVLLMSGDEQEVVEFKEAWDSARLEEEEDFSDGSCGKYQQKLWDLFDKPHTSLPARVGRP